MALSLLLARGEGEARADDAPLPMPPPVREADLEEHLGAYVPKNIVLRDEKGEAVTTESLFSGDLPVLLVLAYYRCPMLCPLLVNGEAKRLADDGYVPGRDYRLVTVSIDPEDDAIAAEKRREGLIAKLDGKGREGIRFLVGDAAETQRLANAVGIRFAKDEKTDQYAHPAVSTVLSPGGRISRYMYGVEPSSRDLRLSLVEAAEGKIGTLVDRVLVTCYRWDPSLHRYGPAITGFFRIGGLVILAAVLGGLGFAFRNERRRMRQ